MGLLSKNLSCSYRFFLRTETLFKVKHFMHQNTLVWGLCYTLTKTYEIFWNGFLYSLVYLIKPSVILINIYTALVFLVIFKVIQPACWYLSYLKIKSCCWAVQYRKERQCLPSRERAVPLPTSTYKQKTETYFILGAKTSSCYTFNIQKMLSWDFSRNLLFGQERRVLSSSEVQMDRLPSLQALLLIPWIQSFA